MFAIGSSPIAITCSGISLRLKPSLGLARAFLHNKNIILIDEGTSALDHRNAENVVNNLLSDAGLTVIFVSHTLSDEVLNRFDKVVAL